jgi:hypothetical protein
LHIWFAVQSVGVLRQLWATQIMFTQAWLAEHSFPLGQGLPFAQCMTEGSHTKPELAQSWSELQAGAVWQRRGAAFTVQNFPAYIPFTLQSASVVHSFGRGMHTPGCPGLQVHAPAAQPGVLLQSMSVRQLFPPKHWPLPPLHC